MYKYVWATHLCESMLRRAATVAIFELDITLTHIHKDFS